MDKIGSFYRTELNKYKSNECFDGRIKELVKAGERLEEWIKTDLSCENIRLSCAIQRLDCLVTSYFYDVIRYKHFHGMLDDGKEARVNFQKIYSYTTKWILREKPLSAEITADSTYKNMSDEIRSRYHKYALVINELWALSWIESSYYAQCGQTIDLRQGSDDLIYTLKYREFSVAIFERWLDLFLKRNVQR